MFILVEHCDVLEVELALEIKTFNTGFVFIHIMIRTNYCTNCAKRCQNMANKYIEPCLILNMQ